MRTLPEAITDTTTNQGKARAGASNTRLYLSSDKKRNAGDALLRTFKPVEGTAKTFCLVCGSNLFGGGWPESPTASVRASALDDPFEARPSAHIFVRSVAAWETLPEDGLQRFDTTSG